MTRGSDRAEKAFWWMIALVMLALAVALVVGMT